MKEEPVATYQDLDWPDQPKKINTPEPEKTKEQETEDDIQEG